MKKTILLATLIGAVSLSLACDPAPTPDDDLGELEQPERPEPALEPLEPEPAAEGAPCERPADCRGLRCVRGSCEHGEPGSPCEVDQDCIAGACVADVCTLEADARVPLGVDFDHGIKQHFCCSETWVDEDERLAGSGCFTVGKESADRCSEVLYCAGSWKKSEGVVTCH
ncbi:MAG: hypothetical protein R6X02_28265 [Enhygromyxa sp.]